jgi:hypothetical protein
MANQLSRDKAGALSWRENDYGFGFPQAANHQEGGIPMTGCLRRSRSLRFELVGLTTALATMSALATIAASAPAPSDISRCRAIADPGDRFRCYESLTPPVSPEPSPATPPDTGGAQNIGKWRLVRTPAPSNGKEAISITRPGELSGSDPDFAGLMIRCADSDIEVLVILISAMSLRAHPRVSINGQLFESTVAPPGSAILLPKNVVMAARERWPSLATLDLAVDNEGLITKGRVDLTGLQDALNALNAACASRQ